MESLPSPALDRGYGFVPLVDACRLASSYTTIGRDDQGNEAMQAVLRASFAEPPDHRPEIGRPADSEHFA
jgi:hypothetical protein